MGKVLNPSMRLLQGEADEYVMLNHSKEVFEHYQSLVKGSERISTGIFSVEERTAQQVALMRRQAGDVSQEVANKGTRNMEGVVSSAARTTGGEVAESVVEAGGKGMASRTINKIVEAGETAAKVMRFRL
jgi:hypothetical protein